MAMDPRLNGYLIRALGHEMAAVQQYLAQSKLCELWGMAEFAGRFRQEAVEELGHVESLMEALLRLGIAPHAAQLPPVRLGRTLLEMIEIDRVLEVEAVRLYEEAATYCTRLRNSAHHALFEQILRDELGHLEELDTMSATLSTKEKCYV